MGSRLLTCYALACPVAVLAFVLAGSDGWAAVGAQVGLGVCAVAAVVAGVRAHRPPAAAAWLCFGAGVACNVTGILVEAVLVRVAHSSAYPSFADLFWLGLYPGLVAGMLVLIRRRNPGRDRLATVDATTITSGLALLSWVYMIHPRLTESPLSLLQAGAVLAYPIGDVVVLAMMVRMLLDGGTRVPAFRLMVGAVAVFLAGDLTWVALHHLGHPSPTGLALRLVQSLFLVAYLLVGAAALHPSVREVATAAPNRSARMGPAVIAGLTTASLIAPGVLAVQALRGQITDALPIALSWCVLLLMVAVRMRRLRGQVDAAAQALQTLSLGHTDELTGLPNRRASVSALPLALAQAAQDRSALSVAMVDLDDFKRFNAGYGHKAGDRLLKGLAAAWREKVRHGDQLARYDGEAFLLLLPFVTADQACKIVDRLRGVTPTSQRFSAGVATWDGREHAESLLERADLALYRAKEAGGDRTVIAQPGSELAARG
jgi:diguanylate cyclase